MQTTVRQDVDVVGRIWQGCRSAYTYKLNGEAIPTPEEVSHIAGDFAQVTDYRVRRTESSVEYRSDTETIFTKRHLLAKDWERKASQRTFEKCTNEF